MGFVKKKMSSASVYGQLKENITKSIQLLDEDSQTEIRDFVRKMQNHDGGFKNRAGESNIYYSMFGFWLVEVLGENHLKENLIRYIHKVPVEKNFIHTCCRVLLTEELNLKQTKRVVLWSLVRALLKERVYINQSYREIVLFLTLESLFQNSWWIHFIGKKMLTKLSSIESVPCTEMAAMLILKKMKGENDPVHQRQLLSLFDGENGFKSFAHVENGDMLSTAVALFALKYVGADLRLVTPGCLEFIQRNFNHGAFLSGDFESVPDVEYTFYGLLALGTLA